MQKHFVYLSLFCSSTALALWQHPQFGEFSDNNEKQLFQTQIKLKKGSYPLQFYADEQCFQAQTTIKLNQRVALIPCTDEIPQLRIFRESNYLAQIDTRNITPTLYISIEKTAQSQQSTPNVCPKWNKQPLEIDVKNTFAEGEIIRDFYSGNSTIVKNGKVTLIPAPQSDGLLLLEKSAVQKPDVFNWKNATVYFVLTDRFYNGNPRNDHSYGRQKDGMQEIGTFHGGDLQGLTKKLDYLQQLGVNVLWISSPLEQMHGWVGGGSKGDFPHYAYHGYYHQDWTKIDANMGNEQDLQEFVQQAHQRGIRVLFDIVMNHTGYASLADMQEFGFGAFYLKEHELKQVLSEKWTNWKPKLGQNWHSFNDYINFTDKNGWQHWWGKDWVRSDISDYDSPKFDDLKMSLASLPDLKTESENIVELPPFFYHKQTNAKTLSNARVRDYLITWLSDWVRKYGIDGFRVDTAKHVEKSTWLQLKRTSEQALREWQASHPQRSLNDNFWMIGEAWGHGVFQSDYYQNGFDAMINFDFQDQASQALDCFANLEPVYRDMSDKIQHFNVLSYLSSHDTRLFFHTDSKLDATKQKIAANALLLAPGAIQIYYGDESGREFGPTGSDPMQGTRSDMNWQDIDTNPEKQALLRHWQLLSSFRQRHPAIGSGKQYTFKDNRYFAFSREAGDDKVMIVWGDK